MARKLGKFIFWTAAIGTVAAGVYYYLQHKEEDVSKESDHFEDFDDFDDVNDEDHSAATSTDTSERSYVSLDLDTSATDEVEDFFDDEESDSPQTI